MPVPFWADFFRQCRLARWEEEHRTVDAVQLLPFESLPFPRFICAGQFVKFKVCASSPVGASIGFGRTEHDDVSPEPFDYNAEASSLLLEHLCRRTDDYDLTVHNHSNGTVDVIVEIHAPIRERSARTILESIVNKGADLICRNPRFVGVYAVTPPTRPPDQGDDSEPRDSSRAAGA